MSSFHSKDRRQADKPRASVDNGVRYQPVISPLSDLMADLDRIRYGGHLSPDSDNGHFDVWQDNDHIYVECELNKLKIGNFDISTNEKFIFIRIEK